MHDKLLVVGAGGQGKVVIDAARSAKKIFEIVLSDDDETKSRLTILGHPIVVPVDHALGGVKAFHVAIGQNAARERISDRLAQYDLANPSIFHARACISETAKMGDGVFIAANAVIAPDVQIDRGCIINHGAIVDHDCHIAAFSHIAPGTTLGGGVRVGKRVLIGAGANVLPGISIGDDCVVGAGAVVLNDLKPGSVHVGIPAYEINK